MKRTLLLVLAVLSLGMARRAPEKKSPQKRRPAMDVSQLMVADAQWHGLQCQVTKPEHQIVKDKAAWEALWSRAFKQPAPPVDFSKRFAVAVFAGVRHTGGYSVVFLPAESDGKDVVIKYRIRAPGKGSFVIQAFTQPYSVQMFKATQAQVRVVEAR
jgi:hypothetical protein